MSKSMLQAPVIAVNAAAAGTVRLTLEAPIWAVAAHAGHFVNIQVPQRSDLLWRRPFSLHRADPARGTIDLLVAAAGRGSQTLARCKAGDRLDTLGLLGNTFPLDPAAREIIMVAGGIGIAPFDLLLQDAAAIHCRKTLFYGARSGEHLCRSPLWEEYGVELCLATEDGSVGHHGRVLEPLRRYLGENQDHAGRILYGCGPTPMLSALRTLALETGLKGYISVENLMACGFGACVGCPVELATPRPDGQKYLLACKDGPVFPIEEILLHD